MCHMAIPDVLCDCRIDAYYTSPFSDRQPRTDPMYSVLLTTATGRVLQSISCISALFIRSKVEEHFELLIAGLWHDPETASYCHPQKTTYSTEPHCRCARHVKQDDLGVGRAF